MPRHGNPFRAAVAALRAGIADRLKQNTADESLIADLLARSEGGTVPAAHAATLVPLKAKHRRRRRRAHARRAAKAMPVQARRTPRDKRAVVDATPDVPKPATDTKPVAAPDPTVAAAAKARRAAHMREYRARRRQEAAGEEASAPKPKKRAKAPRKPAVPIPAPVVQRTAWHPDENGNLTREVITS
jgi:hypothetical protein